VSLPNFCPLPICGSDMHDRGTLISAIPNAFGTSEYPGDSCLLLARAHPLGPDCGLIAYEKLRRRKFLDATQSGGESMIERGCSVVVITAFLARGTLREAAVAPLHRCGLRL